MRGFSRTLNPGWLLTIVLIVGLLSVPVVYIFLYIFQPADEIWTHVVDNLLGDYIVNTGLLLSGMVVLSLLLGVPAAWLVSTCLFPMRRVFSWALILPLAIPAYINAYIYKDMFSRGLLSFTGNWFNASEIMSLKGAVLVMSSVLYPYVYLIARSSFEKQSQSAIEVSRLLGKSGWHTFLRIALPLARPAIAGSLFLIIMEGLNEYGTMKYYGISTFTTGIFRAWFSLGSVTAAIRLAAVLLFFVFVLITLERWQRGRARFGNASHVAKPLYRTPLSGVQGWLAFAVCLVPFSLGFLLPVIQLLHWAIITLQSAPMPDFAQLLSNSLLLSIGSGFVVVVFAFIISYVVRISQEKTMQWAARIASMGYAIPGAVIAIGSMAAMLALDQLLSYWLGSRKTGLWLSGTYGALIYAYSVRFLTVAISPVDSGFQQISRTIDDASLLSGSGRLRTLWRVHLPLLRHSLAAAVLLVFVDVLKELPLTLILRPFNMDTLATSAFELADDEQLAAASVSSLIIIAAGLLPVILLNRLVGRKN